MKKKEKKKDSGKVVWFVMGSVLTIAGLYAIPPLIQKYGDKVYKKSLNTDDIDFDDMGPEIVPFDVERKEQ